MGEIHASSGSRAVSIEAVIIRADGTREDLGVIARWHKNPLVRFMWAMQDAMKNRRGA